MDEGYWHKHDWPIYYWVVYWPKYTITAEGVSTWSMKGGAGGGSTGYKLRGSQGFGGRPDYRRRERLTTIKFNDDEFMKVLVKILGSGVLD